MRVIVTTSTFPLDDHEYWGNFVADLNTRLAHKGVDILTVVPRCRCWRRTRFPEHHLHEFDYILPRPEQILGCPPGLEYNVKSLKGKLQMPFYLLFFTLNVLKQTLKMRPHLIHANWAIPSGLVSLLVGRLTRTRVMVTVHGADVYQSGIRKSVVRFVLERVDHVVCVSSHVLRLVSIFAKPRKVTVVPNAVDVAAIQARRGSADRTQVKASLGMSPESKMILTVRRLVPEKRVQDLVVAAGRVLKSYQSVSFVIAGDGPELGRLKELARSSPYPEKILFLGSISESQKLDLLSSADICVQTSVQEGLSLALLESMAAGAVVVASSSAGQTDIIRDGETGFLFEPLNVEQLADRILSVLGDPSLRVVGERAALLVQNEYSLAIHTTRYLEVYKSCMS